MKVSNGMIANALIKSKGAFSDTMKIINSQIAPKRIARIALVKRVKTTPILSEVYNEVRNSYEGI